MAEQNEDSLIGYDPLAWMHRSDFNHDSQKAQVSEAEADSSTELASSTETASNLETDLDQAPADASESYASQSERAVLVLDSVLNIQNVSALHQRLTQMLSNFEAIDIDASGVTMIDTATLQLLLILKQTAIGLQKSVSIDFPSDKFIEASELLGIAEMLEVDQAASGFF
ncbi:STAS domain-containing protein [Methylomonas sp. LW13]|uniref:STAS domain-containing protein n=1 Tax=unclassified Methylomonas TaxID=2608980 RepID=UPI0006898453|nr:STAS domain-containing protein [Methylomonas sp. LW13]QBC26950.1 STAS domain-containing protein [Methylomonas sp. LW13]